MFKGPIHKMILMISFLFISSMVCGQMANYKSLYLYNFIKRIEWPVNQADQNFIMVIMGDDATANAVQQIAETKKVGDKNILVINVKEAAEVDSADMIYVDYSKRKHIEELAIWIGEQPILLVSDYKNAELTDINLVETSDGLEFIIRPEKIREKNLKLSDMLILLGKQEEE